MTTLFFVPAGTKASATWVAVLGLRRYTRCFVAVENQRLEGMDSDLDICPIVCPRLIDFSSAKFLDPISHDRGSPRLTEST